MATGVHAEKTRRGEGLVLVDDEGVGRAQGVGVEVDDGREVEADPGPGGHGPTRRLVDDVDGDLALEDDDIARREPEVGHVLHRERVVGARHDDDRVLTRVGDGDEREAGGGVRHLADAPEVDAGTAQQ